MKLFYILNKPANKAGNKQAGIVFLEYVIMAFIATVAVICAIWWLYWHLQQLTWEIKDRLNNLPKTCPLETPYSAAPEDQPTHGGRGTIGPITILNTTIQEEHEFLANYAYQTVTIQNNSSGAIQGLVTLDGGKDFDIPSGNTWTYTGTVDYGPDPYYRTYVVLSAADDPTGSFTVTITPG